MSAEMDWYVFVMTQWVRRFLMAHIGQIGYTQCRTWDPNSKVCWCWNVLLWRWRVRSSATTCTDWGSVVECRRCSIGRTFPSQTAAQQWRSVGPYKQLNSFYTPQHEWLNIPSASSTNLSSPKTRTNICKLRSKSRQSPTTKWEIHTQIKWCRTSAVQIFKILDRTE